MNLVEEIIEIFDAYSILTINRYNDTAAYVVTAAIPRKWSVPTDIKEGMNIQKVNETTNTLILNVSTSVGDLATPIEFLKNLTKFNKENEIRQEIYKKKLAELKKLVNEVDLDELDKITFGFEEEFEDEEDLNRGRKITDEIDETTEVELDEEIPPQPEAEASYESDEPSITTKKPNIR